MSGLGSWLRAKLWEPVMVELKQGLSPSKLALSAALGLWISLFPALGVTTLLCAAAALLLRLNMGVIQSVNYAAYPLQFLMLFPFFRAGAWLFQSEPLSLSPSEFVTLVTQEPMTAIRQFWWLTWHGAAVWALLGLLLVPALWALLTAVFTRIARRQKEASQ